MCATLGFFVAVRLGVFFTISRAIRKAAIGRLVFDALFDNLLGVTPDNPQGDTKLTKALHGLPVKEVEARLNHAAAALLETEVVEATIPGLALWLAAKVQRVFVWATIRVIVSQCTVGGTRDASVDLLELRNRLAGRIDNLIADWLKRRVTRFTLWLAGLTVALAVLVAIGIRQLPF